LIVIGAPSPRASTTGLVAAYAFSEGSGTTVADLSGNGNTGTISNAAWTSAGRNGNALTFNGSSSWVTVADAASLHLAGALTLEAWVRPTAAMGTSWRTVLMKQQTAELAYALYANSDTSVPTVIAYIGGEQYARGTSQLALNTWTHLAGTYDGTTLRMYVNGVQVSSRALSGNVVSSTGPLRIGGNSVWGEYFAGVIDDVRVYNRALSSAEIQSDMNTPVGGTPAPDTTPPTPPGSFAATGSTQTSIATAWAASSDNVGVTGYNVYADGIKAGSTTGTAFTFSGLVCGTSHALAVEAFDAAGNVSTQSTVVASTGACPDTTPPTPPTGLTVTTTTPTAIALAWSASTDDVGVTSYGLYANGTLVGSSATTSGTVGGLLCATQYVVGVDAADAAGNRSTTTTLTATTAACDVTAPTVSITAPPDGASVSGNVAVTADAADDVGVAGVQFQLDGAPLGAEDTTAPYGVTWNTSSVPNGRHILTAVARDTSSNTATSAQVTVTVANTLNTADAFKKVDVGPGLVDASTRQVVRTAGDRVYIFATDDTAQRQNLGPGVLRAWRANQTGIPTSFTEVDGADRPTAGTNTSVICSPDVKLDANGLAHMVYVNQTNATLVYQTFSTVTDTWGLPQVIASGVNAPNSFILRESANSIVVDQSNVDHVVYAAGSKIYSIDRAGTGWSAPVAVATGTPVHPELALGTDGVMRLAWLDDASQPSIRYAERPPGGAWGAPQTVASSGVLSNSDSDQGPSIVVTPSGIPYVGWVGDVPGVPTTSGLPFSPVRVSYRPAGSWVADNPPTDIYTHTPQIYGHGNDMYVFLGHDDQIRYGYLYHLSGQPWSSYMPLTSTSDGTLDGSANVRWDPLRETNAGVIDTTFFDEDRLDNQTYLPELYYMAVLPASSGPADTTPPTVSLTAPTDGTTVGGTTTVGADASDNVGVAGVQFELDGAPLGAEDTAAPYSISWDTTAAANGTHTLAAVARDAAGNRTTSPAVSVTVSNAPPPPDASPPSVALTAPAAGATVSGTTTVSADASDNVGVAGVQFELDGAPLGAEDTTAPYSISWDTTGASNGSHTLTAVARDGANNQATSAPVAVTVANPVLLLGDPLIEAAADSNVSGRAEAFRATASASGTLTKLHVYVAPTSAATKLTAGVYTDSGGHPGTLIGQGTLGAVVDGAWNTVAVPAAAITSGKTYWIALLSPNGAGTLAFRDNCCSGTASETSKSSSLTTLPATWRSGAVYGDGPASVYGSQ
jgi:chitodextrinase